MENVMKKVESFFEKKMAEFEKNPLKTSIKIIVTIWLLKTAYTWLMKQDEE